MMFWAVVVVLVSGAFAYAGDLSSTLVSFAEIVGVIALFTLVCAAEAFSIPKKASFDKNSVQTEA